MGRPSKRGELLDAGVAILHRRGYAASSVESITEAAGVPKGALFNHFGSKEGFTNEALRRYFEPWRETASLILDDSSLSAVGKLHAMISAVTGMILKVVLARRSTRRIGPIDKGKHTP